MKSLLLIVICLFLTAFISFGQNRKVPAKTSSTKHTQASSKNLATVDKISEIEWNEIVKAVSLEDWNKTSLLVSAAMKKLKTDNEDKQLARLRYFSLYSLAGKVMQEKATFSELEKTADSFIGQDFLMPSREIVADCVKKLNYICPVPENDKALRVTTINKEATSIISFEYVQLPQKFDVETNSGKQVFLGGNLKKIELNPNNSTVWIMRLSFENGIALLKK